MEPRIRFQHGDVYFLLTDFTNGAERAIANVPVTLAQSPGEVGLFSCVKYQIGAYDGASLASDGYDTPDTLTAFLHPWHGATARSHQRHEKQ
jgi:hypothetical protein